MNKSGCVIYLLCSRVMRIANILLCVVRLVFMVLPCSRGKMLYGRFVVGEYDLAMSDIYLGDFTYELELLSQ